jgi:hypothetical protein
MDILTERTTRRTLYRAIISSLGALIAAALAIPASLYLLIKPKNREADWVEIADVRQLESVGRWWRNPLPGWYLPKRTE